jgi:hypothetical protein
MRPGRNGNGNGSGNPAAEDAYAAEREAYYAAKRRMEESAAADPLKAREGKAQAKTKEERERGTGLAHFTTLSEVKSQSYDWLWEGRIAIGEPATFFGDCDLGKSTLSISLAATITVGGCWPDRPEEPIRKGDVVFIQDENTLDTTVRPRIDAAGGDPRRIHSLDYIEYPGGIEDFNLARHARELEEGLKRWPGTRLLVIDPVTAYLGGMDGDNSPQVRGALRPLARIARARGIAVILITHPNKGAGTKAKYRASGSAAFINVPRAAFMVAADPDMPDERRLVAPVKFNLGPKPSALAYRFDGVRIAWEPDPIPGLTADYLLARESYLAAKAGKRGPIPCKRIAAEDWLRSRLAAGPVLLATLIGEGRTRGVSESTLERALRSLKACSLSSNGVVFYQLPSSESGSGDEKPEAKPEAKLDVRSVVSPQ